MRPLYDDMDVKLDDTPGALSQGRALPVRDRWHHTVQVGGTFSADVRLEASDDDGVTWAQLAAFSAAGIYHLEGALGHLRIRTEDYTSGTPIATYGGVDARANT